MNMRYFLVVFTVLCSGFLFSQEDEGIPNQVESSSPYVGEIKPKHTFNISIGLPQTVANKPFRRIMTGIVDVNPYYQFSLPNSIVFGAGFRFMHFKVNEFRVPETLDGVMNGYGGFVKVGYEKFFTTRFAMDFSMKMGYNAFSIRTDLNTKVRGGNYKFDAGFVEPTVSFIVSATERSSYRLTVGYTVQGYNFKLNHLGSFMNGGYTESELAKNAQFFTFGLGYTYYFGKKKD